MVVGERREAELLQPAREARADEISLPRSQRDPGVLVDQAAEEVELRIGENGAGTQAAASRGSSSSGGSSDGGSAHAAPVSSSRNRATSP